MQYTTQIYQAIAQQVSRKLNILNGDNLAANWSPEHRKTVLADCDAKIKALMDEAPHGSGFDGGIHLLEDDSTPNRLVFSCDFHHMNDSGYYDGWSDHTAIVTPDLAFGYSLRITGRNRNDIKEYIAEALGCWLNTLWADQ